MKIQQPRVERIARKAGGLFLGLLFHFPCNMSDRVDELEGTEFDEYQMATVTMGLICWRLTFHVTWNHKRRELWREMES